MPTPLIPLTIQAPGKKGLNSQSSSTSLDLGWATELENAVFDLTGRATSRKGISKLTVSGGPGANNLSQVFCWEGFNSNVPVTGVISTGNLKVYDGSTTLTDKTGTITAPTANNWQFMNFRSNKVVGCQQAHTPIVATIAAGAIGNFADLVAASGSLPTGNCGLAAFGRIWILDSDNTTIKYSALLDETKWAAADGGGSIDTTQYWPKGRDYVVALTAWEDKLIIFGRHSIIIYNSPAVVASLILADVIEGVGCIARDSVRSVGTDVFFLSESGVHSLKQSVITQKAPLQDISFSVRDSMISYFTPGTANNIRSAYNQIEGLYILSVVGTSTTNTYAFDLKNFVQASAQEDFNSIRVSQWTGWPIHGMAYGRDGNLYLSFRSGSNEAIGTYASYYDDTTSYTLKYSSPWVDLANPEGGESGTFLKIPKSAKLTTVGSSRYQIILGLAFDFDSVSFTNTASVNVTASMSEWNGSTSGSNLTEWGLAEWNAQNKILTSSTFELGRDGQHMRITIQIPIVGKETSIQKLDVFFKKGRVSY
jgi:hypothetical protein